MDKFSISDLERYSGIRAHTIRIWEKRYNALKPMRSDGNTRYYDNSQLRRLLNIVSLINEGYKISDLAVLTDKQLFNIIENYLNNYGAKKSEEEYFIFQLLTGAMSFDEAYFEKLFSACMLRYGLMDMYLKIIYPMLVRIGLMWCSDAIPPAQEHFITNIIRQKILVAIDSLPPPVSSQNSWLLFLPENEFHEIGLLFAHYIVKAKGKKVFYFGSNFPYKTLADTIKIIAPSNLLFFLVHHDIPENIQNYLNVLTNSFKKIKIYLSGNKNLLEQVNATNKIILLHSVKELEREASK